MPEEQTDDQRRSLDPFETSLIARKAASLVRRGLVPRADHEDARQELAVALLAAHANVDLDHKTRHGFAVKVVNNTAANLIRGRWNAKRNPHRVCSLDARLAGDQEAARVGSDGDFLSQEQPADLGMDLERVLEKLPKELRALAETLKENSISAAAELLGKPRSTLYTPLKALRARFRQAGLEKYLPTISDGLAASGGFN